MFLEKGCHFDMKGLLIDFRDILGSWYQALFSGNTERIAKTYLENLYLRNQETSFMEGDKKLKGRIMDVTEPGELVIELDNGERRYFGFKEVEYLR